MNSPSTSVETPLHRVRRSSRPTIVVLLFCLAPCPVSAGGAGIVSSNACCGAPTCQTNTDCEVLVPDGMPLAEGAVDGLVRFSLTGNLDSVSRMGDPVPVAPNVSVSEWLEINAEGRWGILGNVQVRLGSQGASRYTMVSQSDSGSPFFPVDVETEIFWKIQATHPLTGETLILRNLEPAVYRAQNVSSFPPEPGTRFLLSSPLSLSDPGGEVTCSTESGESSVAYSGNVLCTPVVINEVNTVRDDKVGHGEFIELFDGGVGHTPLDGVLLVLYEGTSGQAVGSPLDLAGFSTDAEGFFVIGEPDVNNVDLVTTTVLVDPLGAAALYNNVEDPGAFEEGASPTTNFLYDAVIWGASKQGGTVLSTLLRPGEPVLDENGTGNAVGNSLQRIPDGGWRRSTLTYRSSSPTPGKPNRLAPIARAIPTLSGWGSATLFGLLLTAGVLWILLRSPSRHRFG